MVTYRQTEYENYGKCLWIENGAVEAVVSLDVGPRILRFAFAGGRNLLRNELDRSTRWQGAAFEAYYGAGQVAYAYGGHRIWVTPEREPQTYYPDNAPVAWEKVGEVFRFTPPPQKINGIQITLTLEMDPQAPILQVGNEVENITDDKSRFAVWSVTAMEQGGTAYLRQAEDRTGYLPNRTLSLWAYTKVTDPRITLTDRFLTVRQDTSLPGAGKIGLNDRAGRALYRLGEDVFRRETAPHDPAESYPDGGVSAEIFFSTTALEVEALGPIRTLEPGGRDALYETWSLVKAPDAALPVGDDAIDAFWQAVWA